MRLLSLLHEKIKKANRRLLVALGCYVVLILVALYVLLPVRSSQDRFLLGLVLLVFALLIVKTLVHVKDEKLE